MMPEFSVGRKVEFTIYRGGIGWVVGPDLGGGVRSSVLDLGSGDAPGHSWVHRSLGLEI